MDTNGNRIGSKTKGKLSAWSYFIWFETKFKSIDFSGCNKFPISCRNLFGNWLALVNWCKPFPTTSLPWWTQISTMNMSSKNILNRNRNSIEIVAKLTYSKHPFHRTCSTITYLNLNAGDMRSIDIEAPHRLPEARHSFLHLGSDH